MVFIFHISEDTGEAGVQAGVGVPGGIIPVPGLGLGLVLVLPEDLLLARIQALVPTPALNPHGTTMMLSCVELTSQLCNLGAS